MLKAKLICALILITPMGLVSAEQTTHKKVQAALDWELPVNKCKKPRRPGANNIALVDGEGATRSYDIDSYELGRYQRKEKRWKKCVAKYKKKLLNEFEDLKSSAQYGMTKQQADIVLGKMARLQSVYMTPDGVPAAEEEPQPD